MKKLLALVLIGTLGAGLITGCGNTSSQTSSAASSSAASSSAAVSNDSSASVTSDTAESSVASETSSADESTYSTVQMISPDEPYTYDVDEIALEEGTPSEDGWTSVSASYAGNVTEIDTETYGLAEGESFVIDDNGQVYVFVCCMYDNDGRYTYLLKLNKDTDTLEKTDDIYASLDDDLSNVSVDNIRMATIVNDFGSYTGTRSYKIEGGKLIPTSSEYEITLYDEDGQSLTVAKSFEATLNGETVTINAGDVLHATAVDEDNKIFKFTVGDNTDDVYEVSYTYDDEDPEHTIDGVSEYDLFEMLPYAG